MDSPRFSPEPQMALMIYMLSEGLGGKSNDYQRVFVACHHPNPPLIDKNQIRISQFLPQEKEGRRKSAIYSLTQMFPDYQHLLPLFYDAFNDYNTNNVALFFARAASLYNPISRLHDYLHQNAWNGKVPKTLSSCPLIHPKYFPSRAFLSATLFVNFHGIQIIEEIDSACNLLIYIMAHASVGAYKSVVFSVGKGGDHPQAQYQNDPNSQKIDGMDKPLMVRPFALCVLNALGFNAYVDPQNIGNIIVEIFQNSNQKDRVELLEGEDSDSYLTRLFHKHQQLARYVEKAKIPVTAIDFLKTENLDEVQQRNANLDEMRKNASQPQLSKPSWLSKMHKRFTETRHLFQNLSAQFPDSYDEDIFSAIILKGGQFSEENKQNVQMILASNPQLPLIKLMEAYAETYNNIVNKTHGPLNRSVGGGDQIKLPTRIPKIDICYDVSFIGANPWPITRENIYTCVILIGKLTMPCQISFTINEPRIPLTKGTPSVFKQATDLVYDLIISKKFPVSDPNLAVEQIGNVLRVRNELSCESIKL